ncbi:unnamed protein product [Arabis nemorensis]|uniref:Uncharacterized protein n=1 Tax=Arabis nemorensis TaxID=586526 RepID=A0A565C8L7_9BRAS|nr:unnamed protein product [Arabis nemorensis]
MQETTVAPSIQQAMPGLIEANAAINNAQRRDRNNPRFNVALKSDAEDKGKPQVDLPGAEIGKVRLRFAP